MLKRKNQGKTNLLALAVVAVLIIGGAFLAYRDQGESAAGDVYHPAPLFKGIDLDQVDSIKIITEADTVEVKRASDKEWGLASRGGFPVEAERVTRLGLAVSQLQPSERMTKNPEKYATLGVDEKKPESGRVQLLDKEGKQLADVFVGSERKDNPGVGRGEGQFIRVGTDPWVYMIPKRLELDTQSATWLKKEILNVDEKTVQRVVVSDVAANSAYTLERTGAEPFKIVSPEIPAGQRPKTAQISATSRALANLSMSDVLPADDPKLKDVAFGTEYHAWLKNGLEYVVEAGKLNEDYYARVRAQYDKPRDLSIGDARTSDSVAAKELGAGEAKAKELTEKNGKWVYKIQNWTHTNLTKPFAELLEPIPSPSPSPAPSPSPTPSMEGLLQELKSEAAPAAAPGAAPEAAPATAPPAEAPPAAPAPAPAAEAPPAEAPAQPAADAPAAAPAPAIESAPPAPLP